MIAFLIGTIIGFVTALPTGPINLAVMMKGLSNKTGQGLMIGAGSGFMDIVYCAAAVFGVSTIITTPKLELGFRIATFVIFLFFGIRTTFFKLAETKMQQSDDSPGFKRYFLLGILMYLSNPSFIAYWITVAGIVHGYHVIEPSFYDNFFFAIGTGAGTTLWFFTLLELVEKQKMRFDNTQIQKITRLFGVILLLVSAVMGYELIVK